MNYNQAKMIIWNPDAYDAKTLRQAVLFILSSLSAKREDVDQASLLV
jgi:hypothetical protein